MIDLGRRFLPGLKPVRLLPPEGGFEALIGDERLAFVEGGAQVGDVGEEALDKVCRGDERRCVVGGDDQRLAAEAIFLNAKTASGGEVARIDVGPEDAQAVFGVVSGPLADSGIVLGAQNVADAE